MFYGVHQRADSSFWLCVLRDCREGDELADAGPVAAGVVIGDSVVEIFASDDVLEILHPIDFVLALRGTDEQADVVPFAGFLQVAGLRGNHVVDRAVVLRGLQFSTIGRGVVIQDLNLHSCIGCVAFVRSTDADPVVAAFMQAKLEAEDEV